MNKKRLTKFIVFLLILAMLPGVMPGLEMLAETLLLKAPSDNKIVDIGYTPSIYNDEWYADLAWKWDPGNFPPEADYEYIIIGLNEISRGTGQYIQDAITIPLGGSTTSYHFTEYDPEGLQHGTIYESYVKAQYRIDTQTGSYTVTSQKSNPAKFLTGLHVSVELIPGTNNIKIKWDDVFDTSGRINYKILISDTKGFSQPNPIPDIVASEIGKPDSPVTVNTAEKKLEYIYTFAQPGREYAIKVVPVPNPNVACATADEIEAITIKTDILLKAQKVGYTSEGDTIWKLFWNPIVKGSTFTSVDYELYRYINNSNEGNLFRLIPDEDSYQFIIKKGDMNTYSFRIDAKAWEPGANAPIEFRSNNKVELKEQIPQYPEAPEIVDAFPEADPPLYYDDFLTGSSASVFWRAPKTGEGVIDEDVTYDIYLVDNIEYVNNDIRPPSNFKIASDLSMSESNAIKDAKTGAIIGYRYDLTGLKSNSTYYFVIYAKKNYLVESPTEGFMITRPYESRQSVKVIITAPDAGADKPVAPSSPPLKVHEENGKQMITFTGATFELSKRWYALYNEDIKRWEMVSYDDYLKNENLDPEDPDYENKKKATIVNYLPGWSVVPHVVNYNQVLEAFNRTNKENITYNDLTQNYIKTFEIPQQKTRVPDIPEDEEDQTFTFDITGLNDNGTYLVWVTIENQNGVQSEPSDPIIITTPVDVSEKPVKPTVPENIIGIPSDTFVDLFWTFITNMDYEIRGGKTEKLSEATIVKRLTYDEIKNSTSVRVDSLDPDTGYYFWIKAISRGSQGQVFESDFSDPCYVKTEAYKPPATPTGFGIKNGPDGVTENSITYMWTKLDGLTYILEFADNLDFNDSQMIDVDGDNYTVSGLISNRRYYARLYAYSPKTTLRSTPTRAIMVVTNKSRNDYDSSYDLDDPVTGDGLKIPARLENGIWTISSLGADGHVLAERIRKLSGPVVKLDLTQPPSRTSTIRLELSSVVIDALSALKKELYLVMPWGQYTIRPGTFQTDEYFRMKALNDDLGLRLETVSPASQYKPSSNMQFKTAVTDFRFSYLQGSGQISRINVPIRVELPVADISNYVQGQLGTYGYNPGKGWYKLPTVNDYSLKHVIGELDRPVAVVAATEGILPQPGVPSYIKESMERLQAVYDLKSIKNKPFNHNAYMTQKDILKLIFDVIPASYTDYDIAEKAVGAGLISNTGDVSDSYARRDKAISMLISFYRFKTREKTIPSKSGIWSRFTDLSKADPRYLNDYKFALEMGIIQGNAADLSYPDRLVTIGDFLVFLERTLRLCGEI